MQQKHSSPRSEPTWDGAAPGTSTTGVATPAAPGPTAPATSAQPVRPARSEPRSEQAPAPTARSRRSGWLVGLAIIVGLCVVALLLALMMQVASDQVRRNQQQPATRVIGG